MRLAPDCRGNVVQGQLSELGVFRRSDALTAAGCDQGSPAGRLASWPAVLVTPATAVTSPVPAAGKLPLTFPGREGGR
jgi:hypothetical protein